MKLLRTPDNKFIKKIYLTLLNDSIVYPLKKNWCTLLKDLLSNLGFYDAWLFQDVGNVNIFISALRQRLSDTFIQNGIIGLKTPAEQTYTNTLQYFVFNRTLIIVK